MIVVSLSNSLTGRVEVRAVDAEILILLAHHFNDNEHQDILFTTSEGSFSVQDVMKRFSPRQK